MEEFNLELKKAEDYLEAMVAAGTANKQDCQNVQMHLDNINKIVKTLTTPDVVGRSELLKCNHSMVLLGTKWVCAHKGCDHTFK